MVGGLSPVRGKRTRPVDYTLFARRKIRETLEHYAAQPLDPAATRQALQRLALMGPEVLAVALELMQAEPAEAVGTPERSRRLAFLALVIQELGQPDLVDELVDMLHDPDVADDVKAALIAPLAQLGYDMDGLDWSEIYADPEAVQERFRHGFLEMLDQMGDAGLAGTLDDVLDEREPPSLLEAEARSLGESGDDRAARVLQLLIRQPEADVQLAAIRSLAHVGGPRCLAVLSEFVESRPPWPVAARVRKEAARQVERLTRAGVRPAPCPDPAQIGELRAVWASSLDTEGTRSIWVLRRREQQRNAWNLTIFLLNTVSGLIGIFGRLAVSGATVARLRREAAARMRLVAVDPAYAGALFADALWVTQMAGGRPPRSFGFWQDYVPREWISARPYRVHADHGDAPAPASGRGRGEGNEWRALMSAVDFSSWLWQDTHVYDAADRIAAGLPRRRAEVELCEALLPERLAELRRRLELAGDLLVRTRQRRAGEAALRASAALGGDSPCAHPFVRELVRRSLRLAQRNIAAGLDPRINPDAFR